MLINLDIIKMLADVVVCNEGKTILKLVIWFLKFLLILKC